MKNTNAAILELSNVGIGLPLGADRQWAVRDISLTILPQQTLCLVGESGSGKSVIAQAIMGILPAALPLKEGTIKLLGKSIPKQRSPSFNLLRSVKMGMVFQDAVASLNPIKKVGHQLEEILLVHGISRKERKPRVLKMLSAVLLPNPESAYRSYPHEMSGGQAQRIVIAGALLLNPSLLVADEPTTALDVTTQAEILELITKLKVEFNTSVLFITHDFGVVSEIGDQIAVMKDGKILEQGSVKNVLKNPQNEYTQRLLKAANLDTSIKKVSFLTKQNLRPFRRFR
jgi:peptide/nickel transport system ATP-binding protein